MNNHTILDIGQRLERLVEIVAQLYATDCIVAPYMDRFRELAVTEQLSDDAPNTVVTVRKAVNEINLHARFYKVPSDYYDWSLQERVAQLVAPSIRHLCKTVVFENTRCTVSDTTDFLNSRYYCVITQYVASVNTQKLMNYVRSLKQKEISRQYYNFRLAPADVSFELTGFDKNGVSPIGTSTPMPIILSKSIGQLMPPVFYLGAGDVDWKMAVAVDEFIQKTNCFVADLS
ncbi:YbaK/aminoacyl-tRNA synthetase-associated domain-containing protein [Syncephalis plumigaleata]|nr:YbaK/aminoacyl-tRNA synthetase-associated domain-containing protein [Syncephalis plumigaleata]